MKTQEPTVSARFAPLSEDLSTSPSRSELDVLERWRRERTFESISASRDGARAFVFWEGPPTANGRPGIHHVLARTIKDMVCRFQTMQGKRVVRKAGWDTHGLPVELEVEKKLGISGKPDIEKFGVARFNEECRKSVWTYRKEWEELSERTGYWLDYAHPYVTYEEPYVESVWNLLKRFHDAGLVYHGRRVLPYCGRCGTGLSSHELGQPGVYRDELDPSIFVRFRRRHDATTSRGATPRDASGAPMEHEPESFLAWTTTPWTLPSNFALAVHPDVDYVRARVRHKLGGGGEFVEQVWVAAARADAVLPKGYEVLETRRGSELAGLAYEPLYAHEGAQPLRTQEATDDAWQRAHRVFLATFVTTEDGTGIVHQAPYGADDWELATKNRLITVLGPGANGRFLRDVSRPGDGAAARASGAQDAARAVVPERTRPVVPEQTRPVVPEGTWFKDADAPILEDLKARHLLFKNARENHSYPHCWRCDKPLFYFPAPAWYIRTTAYKDRMLAHNRAIRWIPPEVGDKRFGEWLENNVDWNISRDRYWGTPLPFWVCENEVRERDRVTSCGAIVAIGGVDELRERAGKLPDGFDSHKPSIDEIVLDCERCGGRGTMRRTKSVLDCWFDSGAMPYAQYHWPFEDGRAKLADQFPADFIAEGLDQTRGWFYTLHAIGAFITSLPDAGLPDGPAYRTCVVNGLVLDKDGVKMSKRLGNVIDPWKTVEEHGADAVRWYLLASGNPWLPKRFDPKGIVEVRRRFLGTLINSYKFFAEYARLDGFDPSDPAIPPAGERTEIDRWILSRAESLLATVTRRMQEYDLAGACRAIEDFVVDELSNWYIRRNRRRFWRSETGPDKLAAFATLHACLARVALLSAPVVPFVAEMLWERLSVPRAKHGERDRPAQRPRALSEIVSSVADNVIERVGDAFFGPPRGNSVHGEVLPAVDERLIDARLERSMMLVMRVVEMGRALRERAELKIRQPLRAIHVRSSDPEYLALLATPFATEQVLGELNIRAWGSLAADDGELCRLRAKANFRTLGKRLGARMKGAAQAIEALPSEAIARVRAGQEISVDVGGEAVVLGAEDVQVTLETKAAFDVETDGTLVAFLDTELDEALVAEGIAREVVNRINGLRKEGGLAVDDRIRLALHTEDAAGVGRALVEHAAMIRAETLAVELSVSSSALDPAQYVAHERFDLGDGRALAVGIRRA